MRFVGFEFMDGDDIENVIVPVERLVSITSTKTGCRVETLDTIYDSPISYADVVESLR